LLSQCLAQGSRPRLAKKFRMTTGGGALGRSVPEVNATAPPAPVVGGAGQRCALSEASPARASATSLANLGAQLGHRLRSTPIAAATGIVSSDRGPPSGCPTWNRVSRELCGQPVRYLDGGSD